MTFVKVMIRGNEFSLNSFLVQRLDQIKKLQKRNFDFMFLVDGVERSGKSTLALLCANYLFPKMTIDNIAVDIDDAIKKIDRLPDKSLLMIDEGSLLFSAKDNMRKENRKIARILNVVGQKNLIFIIVLPSFFSLEKYIATKRSSFLLHVYLTPRMDRGRFAYFGKRKLSKLYTIGKKNYDSYSYPESDFVGMFTDYHPEWYDEYLEYKKKTLMSALQGEKPTRVVQKEYILSPNEITVRAIDRLSELMKGKIHLSDISEALGITPASFRFIRNKLLKKYGEDVFTIPHDGWADLKGYYKFMKRKGLNAFELKEEGLSQTGGDED